MNNRRTVVFAPHDDGAGAFAVLCRLARAMVKVAGDRLDLHMYFLNPSCAKDGQGRLDGLVESNHRAFFVPTDNLIWLPKDKDRHSVIGEQIPEILRKWVRPLWQSWPCDPSWIHPNLPILSREQWIDPDLHSDGKKWKHNTSATRWGSLRDLTPQWWQQVALGISMGVPQLHRLARREHFPSVEVGDWFFSVGLRGCMQESFVPSDVIATTEPDLRMIEEDEFKAREIWLTLHQAPHRAYKAHVARSPVRFREMEGALWSGDAPPPDIAQWPVATRLREEINNQIATARGLGRVERVRVAYIVTGKTGVLKGVVEKLGAQPKEGTEQVAIIDLDRADGKITFIEKGYPTFVSGVLQNVPSEERHLATCRASDFGITRSAGGVLGFAETRRPAVLLDEPGHWLGRIQREQCSEAGLCVVIPLNKLLANPVDAIQEQANRLGTNSDLDETSNVMLPVGAETDLARYLLETYVE